MIEYRLECSSCGHATGPMPRAALCPSCDEPQLVRYRGLDAAARLRERWLDRAPDMWRYAELMPLREGESPITLGEGGTPLVELPRMGTALGIRLLVKDEAGNPTGSFKDRGLSAAVTRAVHDGSQAFVLPSAGNAGVALAAYATRAGASATVFVPADTPDAVLARCRAYGADVREVDGLISDCGVRAAAFAEATGAFDLSTLREPYRIEGKKTMGLEILEALGWKPPDAIVYPTGGGTGLIGTWKALRETEEIGWIPPPRTRMYAVQAAGCAPIVRAFEAGSERAARWEDARTTAWGLRVPSARGDRLILRALRESGGGAIRVTDEAMTDEASRVARADGVAIGVEGGAALAGVRRLVETGKIDEGDTVVVFNTGNLWNYGWYSA